MYPRNFLCEEAKIKQRTPLKEELRGIGEEAIWESRFTSFFSSTWRRAGTASLGMTTFMFQNFSVYNKFPNSC